MGVQLDDSFGPIPLARDEDDAALLIDMLEDDR